MRRAAIFILVLSGLVALLSEPSEAAPAPPCVLGGPEKLTIRPAGGVTHNGLIVQRSASDGLYRTDGGQVFSVEEGTLSAAVVAAAQCVQQSPTVTVTALDPFEGPDAGPRTFGLQVEEMP